MNDPLTLSLDSSKASLALAGGKGMNLALLARAGFPVPPGFLITTAAYTHFVDANRLGSRIAVALAALDTADPDSLQQASEEIRSAFAAGAMPPVVVEALRAAVAPWRDTPVAVRSSATAEDLPDMSFAGQQDTILHVVGEANLLTAVVQCWSSLWAARAIGYRARNHVANQQVALAVVVQQMVPSEASGVLFTANPLTGKRSEAVIDATLGLGEALVSGLVEPDHYVVDLASGAIVSKKLGAKEVAIHGREGGGIVTVAAVGARQQAIPDEVILAVAELGRRVEEYYEFPQDIEWGWAGERLYLLQSRPITSLFPQIRDLNPEPVQVFFSFGAVQGMLDPMTPLGRDLMKGAFAGLATAFGLPRTLQTQRVVYESGERLFINVTPVMRHPLGRRVMRAAMRLIEPGAAQAMQQLWRDPRLLPEKHWFRLQTFYRTFRFFAPLMRQLFRVLRQPERQRVRFERRIDVRVVDFTQRSRMASTLARRVALLEELMEHGFAILLPNFLPLIAGGMSMLNLLTQLAKQVGQDALLLTRGLPHNVTTEMDLALWAVAERIREHEDAMEFMDLPAAELSRLYQAGMLPPATQTAVSDFLDRYGMRGVGEIDIGRRRWREDPTPVMQNLRSYLQIPPHQSPPAMFARGRVEAESAVDELCNAIRRTRLGWLKAGLARFAAHRMRALAGARESPKFTMIRLFGVVRTGLLASGRELVAAGKLAREEDLFYLTFSELKALARDLERDRIHRPLIELISERRAAIAREARRRQIPRLLLSDGQAFYEGVATGSVSGDLVGSPVSPGVVEGVVHVIFDPHGTRLEPGEILVCPGTDPAWTPLFLSAGGLITEVGGMMTHGSVVAREYGIPAVVGVHRATTRLQTGQRVRVDGSTGGITILNESGK